MQPFLPLRVLALLALLGPGTSGQTADEGTDREVEAAEVVAELERSRDDADPELVLALAELGTEEGLQGLLGVYDLMDSVYMRRFLLRGIARYDMTPKLALEAVQKLADAATLSSEHELRTFAVETIAGCERNGRAFLRLIVDSRADDEVRVLALERHVEGADVSDDAWYRTLYLPAEDEPGDDDDEGRPHPVQRLRETAFAAIAPRLEAEEVREAAEDRNPRLRLLALRELDARDDDRTVRVADDIYEATEIDPLDRRASDQLEAAHVLARRLGPKVADRFLDDALASTTKRELALGLGDILAGFDDSGVNRKLLRGLGKGKPPEKLFHIHACRDVDDPKATRSLIKLLKDKDPTVQREAMRVLAERGDREALPDLEKLVDKAARFGLVADALGAIGVLRAGEPEWEERLLGYAAHEDIGIRNGALRALSETGAEGHREVVIAALEHEHWSTRLAAARAIERMRVKTGVGALCRRIEKESGRMEADLAAILFRLTGQPFRTNGKLWNHWWETEGADFAFPTAEEFAALEAQEEIRFLKEVSRTKGSKRTMSSDEKRFFGVRVESHRAIFVLDVSRSMTFATRGETVDEAGPERMEIAKRELVKAFDSLSTHSFFNIVVFSDHVDSWRESLAPWSEETLAEAKEYVQEIRPWGGTNLHGALELAFADTAVDSIYLMSDGQPSVGDVVDPLAIREEVAAWNADRGVRIHCVSVGAELEVLRWLAEDSGGGYLEYR